MDKAIYIDISLSKNQSMIAVMLSGIFSSTEIEEMFCFKDANIRPSKKDVTETFNMIMSKEFPNHKQVQLIDIFLLNDRSNGRFVNFRIISGTYFQIDFKFRYNKNLKYYLMLTFAKAINYSNYRSAYDQTINKNNILNNFAAELAKNTSLEELEEIRFVMEYVNSDQNILEKDDNVFDFTVLQNKYSILTKPEIIKFQYEKDGELKYLFVQRNKIGISCISLIIEKAINISTKKTKKKSADR